MRPALRRKPARLRGRNGIERRMKPAQSHRLATSAALGACLLLGVCLTPQAAGARAQGAPLPPQRPTEYGGAAAPAATPAPAHVDADLAPLDPDHPPMLPQASRARMSQCGREWQAMKLAGKDLGVGWRQFATTCLTR